MTFRDVLACAAAALLTSFGAARAQSVPIQPAPGRVVVDIANKPMPLVRAELLRASEAVCASDDVFAGPPSSVCVEATFRSALSRAHTMRAVLAARPAQVASR